MDKSLAKELDVLVGPLRELVLSGRGVGDVETVLVLNRSVEGKGSSIEAVADLDVHLGDITLKRGEVGRVVELSRRLDEKHLTVATVDAQMDLDEKLAGEGFTEPIRKQLVEMTRDYGGVEKVLENIGRYEGVVDFEALEKAAGIRAAEARAWPVMCTLMRACLFRN